MLRYAVIYIALFMLISGTYNATNLQALPSFSNNLLQEILNFDNVIQPEIGPQRESDVLEGRESMDDAEGKKNCSPHQKCRPCPSSETKTNRTLFTKRQLKEIGSLFVNHFLENQRKFGYTDNDFKEKFVKNQAKKIQGRKLYEKVEEKNENGTERCPTEKFFQYPSRLRMPFYKHNPYKIGQKFKNQRCVAVSLYPDNKIPQQYDYIALLSNDDKFVNIPAVKVNVFSNQNSRSDNFSPFFVSTYKKKPQLHHISKLKYRHYTHIPILFINTIPGSLKKVSKRSPNYYISSNKYLRDTDLLIENIKTSLKMEMDNDDQTPKYVDSAVFVNSGLKQKKDVDRDVSIPFINQNQKQGLDNKFKASFLQNLLIKDPDNTKHESEKNALETSQAEIDNRIKSAVNKLDLCPHNKFNGLEKLIVNSLEATPRKNSLKLVKKEISIESSKLNNTFVDNGLQKNYGTNNKLLNSAGSESAPPQQSNDLLTSFCFTNDTSRELEETPYENFTSTVTTATESPSFPVKIEEPNAPEETIASPVEENNLSEAFQFLNLKTFQKLKSSFKNLMSSGSKNTNSSVEAQHLKQSSTTYTIYQMIINSNISETFPPSTISENRVPMTQSSISKSEETQQISSSTSSSMKEEYVEKNLGHYTNPVPQISGLKINEDTKHGNYGKLPSDVKSTSLAQLLFPTHVTTYKTNKIEDKVTKRTHPFLDYNQVASYKPNEYQENNPQMFHPYGHAPNYGSNEYQENNPQMYHPYGHVPNYETNEYQNYNPQTYYPYGHPSIYETNEYQENNPQLYPPYNHLPTYRTNEYQENNPQAYGYVPTYNPNENNPRLHHPYSHVATNLTNKFQEHNFQEYPPYYYNPTYKTNEYQDINSQVYPPYYHVPTYSSNEYHENAPHIFPPYYHLPTYSTNEYQENNPQIYPPYYHVPTYSTNEYQENAPQVFPPYYHVPTYSTNEYQEYNPQVYHPYYHVPPTYSTNEYQENNPQVYPPYYHVPPTYSTNEYQENNPQVYPPYYDGTNENQDKNFQVYSSYDYVPTYRTSIYQEKNSKVYSFNHQVSTYRTNDYQESNHQIYPPYHHIPTYRTNEYQENNPQVYPPYYNGPTYSTNEYQENNLQVYPPYYHVPTYNTNGYQENNPQVYPPYYDRTNEYHDKNPQGYSSYDYVPTYRTSRYQEKNPKVYPLNDQVSTYGTNDYQENNYQIYPPYNYVPTQRTNEYQENNLQVHPPYYDVSTYSSNEYQKTNYQGYPPYYHEPISNEYQKNNPQIHPPYYHIPTYSTNEYQENNLALYPPFYQAPTHKTNEYQKNNPNERVSTYGTNEYRENNPQVYPPYYHVPTYSTNDYQENNPQVYPPYYQAPTYRTNEYQENNPQVYPPYYQAPTYSTNENQENNPQVYPPWYQVQTYSTNKYQENNPQLNYPYHQVPTYRTNQYPKNNPPAYPPYDYPTTHRTNEYQENNPQLYHHYDRVTTSKTNEYQKNNPQKYHPYLHATTDRTNINRKSKPSDFHKTNYKTTEFKGSIPKLTPVPQAHRTTTYPSETFKEVEGAPNKFNNYRDDDLSGILDLLGHDLDIATIRTSDTSEQGILEKIKSKLRTLSKDVKLVLTIQNLLSKSNKRPKNQVVRRKKKVPFNIGLRTKRKKFRTFKKQETKEVESLKHILHRRKKHLVKKLMKKRRKRNT
ncbi:uncharacterized protein LOC123010782 isoform X2 [Tribolium madens]|uniref:uncharacterized protein LOC123010782 isoform X2 n=1 Tax=Tribolium madens TaxID=41895 RepID=UPI001CF74CB6|nr:uncharacterized protein LOC123010782 isoform X2 [Tribolium madens]